MGTALAVKFCGMYSTYRQVRVRRTVLAEHYGGGGGCTYRGYSPGSTVLCRTEEEVWLAEVLVDLVADRHLQHTPVDGCSAVSGSPSQN